MEIKINKEIRAYKETVYSGLTARQIDEPTRVVREMFAM